MPAVANLMSSLPPTPASSSAPVQPAAAGRAAEKAGQDASQGFARTLDNRIKQKEQKPAEKTADARDAEAAPTPDKSQPVEDPAAANPAEAAAIAAGMLAGSDKAVVEDEIPSASLADAAEGEDEDGEKGLLALASTLDKNGQQQGKDTSVADKASAEATRGLAAESARKGAEGAAHAEATTAAMETKAVDAKELAAAARTESTPQTHALAPAQSFAEHLATKLAPQKADAPQFSLPTPVGNAAWAEDMGNRIVWMAGKDLGRAELILTPPHLGRVEISLSLNGDQASASFVAATPAAREALEQALPKLRELMSQAGIDLSQANVSANNAGQQGAQEQAWHGRRLGGHAGGGSGDAGDIGTAPPPRIRSGNGLVDTFA